MFDKRRISPVRQLSLQSESTLRPTLKKQLSVENLDIIEDKYKKGDKNKERPRPIRVAWAENTIHLEIAKRFPESVEVKKCKEYRRPTTAKLRTQSSVEKESILYTRQELAERLRKAWKEREKSKPNLDIFLTQQVEDKTDDDNEDELLYDKNDGFKMDANFFEKKPTKPKTDTENNYVPSSTVSTENSRMNISVTIPSTHLLKVPSTLELETKYEPEKVFQNLEPRKIVRQNSMNIEPEPKPTVERPLTASAKRESFQKRSNTAFTGSLNSHKDFRPALTRTLSVPTKQEPKTKLLTTKRRLKSSRRKEHDEFATDDFGEGTKNKNKKNVRCSSAPGGELVTMVSLVSPAGSDSEEVVEKKENKTKNNKGHLEIPQNISLRKTVKSGKDSHIHQYSSGSPVTDRESTPPFFQ